VVHAWVTDPNLSLSVAVDPRQWFASLAFLKDPFWVHCCSCCTCHWSSMSFPVSVSGFHSMLMTLSGIFYRKLSDCFKPVHWWFTLNGLSLNPDKYKAIIIGTGARQQSEGSLEVTDLGNVHNEPSKSIRSLGVVIDNTLSFDAHVNSVCKAVNYHTKALRHIRKRVTTDVALTSSEHNGRHSTRLLQRHSSRNE